ncbi:Phosphatidylglycerophosphatase A [Sulfurovum sp. enrichment culture clone C5]|uniref:Phosphatidylglycerophosphatase A n=1 Tax=Sulfurovum sp. enrichment culture clone C5 TaxID=497650 RepID=A0A0S4XQ32_9BACT|nr:Phosphatidylglycerophosphatase A [Sulfurovum sp. enrichment culture clone C5]
MSLQKLFLTFFGSGLFPKAPGTAGSLVAFILGIIILYTLGIDTLFILTFAITVIAVVEINKYEAATNSHDNSEIVIDEVSGMWIAMLFIQGSLATTNNFIIVVIGYALSFIFFRAFDIYKPSTIGWIDREVKGGLGVMGDDILAGVASGLLTSLIIVLLQKII